MDAAGLTAMRFSTLLRSGQSVLPAAARGGRVTSISAGAVAQARRTRCLGRAASLSDDAAAAIRAGRRGTPLVLLNPADRCREAVAIPASPRARRLVSCDPATSRETLPVALRPLTRPADRPAPNGAHEASRFSPPQGSAIRVGTPAVTRSAHPRLKVTVFCQTESTTPGVTSICGNSPNNFDLTCSGQRDVEVRGDLNDLLLDFRRQPLRCRRIGYPILEGTVAQPRES
jgi:hypothetical protein